jgi:hypothetical protein
MHCISVYTYPLGNKQTRHSIYSVFLTPLLQYDTIGRTMGSDKVLKTINNLNLILFPFSEKVTNEMLRWTLPAYP